MKKLLALILFTGLSLKGMDNAQVELQKQDPQSLGNILPKNIWQNITDFLPVEHNLINELIRTFDFNDAHVYHRIAKAYLGSCQTYPTLQEVDAFITKNFATTKSGLSPAILQANIKKAILQRVAKYDATFNNYKPLIEYLLIHGNIVLLNQSMFTPQAQELLTTAQKALIEKLSTGTNIIFLADLIIYALNAQFFKDQKNSKLFSSIIENPFTPFSLENYPIDILDKIKVKIARHILLLKSCLNVTVLPQVQQSTNTSHSLMVGIHKLRKGLIASLPLQMVLPMLYNGYLTKLPPTKDLIKSLALGIMMGLGVSFIGDKIVSKMTLQYLQEQQKFSPDIRNFFYILTKSLERFIELNNAINAKLTAHKS